MSVEFDITKMSLNDNINTWAQLISLAGSMLKIEKDKQNKEETMNIGK